MAYIRTEEHKKKMSEAIKKAYAQGKCKKPTSTENYSKANKKRWANSEYKKRVSKIIQEKMIASGKERGVKISEVLSTEKHKKRISKCRKEWFKNLDNKKLYSDRFIKMHKEGKLKINKKDTIPEQQMESIINEIGLDYEKQYRVVNQNKTYYSDFYVESLNLIIEVDGKYWHNYPKGTKKDIEKNKVYSELGFKLLRVWEGEFDLKYVNAFIQEVTM